MTQSVFYRGTGPTVIMGSDAPDSAGKVYYRLTINHPTDIATEVMTFGLGWGSALAAIYAALQQSSIVIPISAPPVDDGGDVAIIDVVVAPQGGSHSVGDLVNLVNAQSRAAQLYRLERVKLQNESTSQQANDRTDAGTAAQSEVDKQSIGSTLSGWWSTLEGDLKWIVAGIALVLVGWWYFTRKSSSG